jgi:NADH-quinone oxidoreductase subunit L
MTAFYMFRVVLLTFHGEPKRPDIYAHIKESPRTMTIPLMVLAALSFWFVFAFNPFGASTGWFMKSLPTPVTVTGSNWYKIGHGTSHVAAHETPAHETVDAQAPVESAGQPAQLVEQPQTQEHGTQLTEAVSPAGQERVADTAAVTEINQTAAAGQQEHKPAVPMENEAQLALEHATHGAHLSAMITSIFVAGLGILFAFIVYFWKKINADAIQAKLQPVHTFLSHKWYFDEIYEQWIVVPGLLLIARLTNWFDAHVVDGAVNGTAYVTRVYSTVSGWFDRWVVDGLVNLSAFIVGFFGLVFRKAQTGRIQTYLAFVVVGIVVLLYIFYFRTLIAI